MVVEHRGMLRALFARIDDCRAKVFFEAATGRFFQVIGGYAVLCRSAYAFGYSLVELFKRAQLRIDVGLSPTFEELDRSFGQKHSPYGSTYAASKQGKLNGNSIDKSFECFDADQTVLSAASVLTV